MPFELIGILGVVFTFGVAIFVHEMGHFIFAKLAKVPVATFSFGFGKKIVKYKLGETVYAIGIIPFGGYVQMGKGQEEKAPEEEEAAPAEEEKPPEEEDEEEKPKEAKKDAATSGIMEDLAALRDIPYLSKILIFSAGVIFNLLTAILVLTLLYTIGFQRDAFWEAQIGEITSTEVAERIPLEEGDRIVSINDQTVNDWIDVENLASEYMANQPNEPLFVVIERDGDRMDVKVPLFLDDGRTSPVFSYIQPPVPAYIGKLIPNLPAEKAGLKQGDFIRAINNQSIESWFEMAEIIRTSPGEPLRFKVERNGEMHYIEVTPRPDPKNRDIGAIGIIMGNPKKVTEQKPFFKSLVHSVNLCYVMTRFLIASIIDLIKNANFAMVRENVGGPVAIAVLSYKAAQSGWADFFNFFAVLNLLLFIFNVLPIPVFDGGHIMIATIEAITGRPIPPKLLVRVFSIMVILIISLAVWVTLNDILMNLWRFGFGK